MARKAKDNSTDLFEKEYVSRIPLDYFVENPDNPQTVTDEAFDRLVEKIKANPNGLRAHRIAFVTDHAAGERVVISGNKRLRALKKIYGEHSIVPVEWFQDVTWMTLEQRKAFIVAANVNEGEWDVEKLLEQYDRDELGGLFGSEDLGELLADIEKGAEAGQVESEDTAESREFEEKFVPKKTTDDCYTPDNIFAAVLEWAAKKYGFDPKKIVRPFFPGADYTKASYPKGYVVVDNPPFSIFSEILDYYNTNAIPFFLFGPAMTIASSSSGSDKNTFIVVNAGVTYANGAVVSTSFVTNLDPEVVIRVEPELRDTLKAINEENVKQGKNEVQKHEYPDCVISTAVAGSLAVHHTPLVIKRSDAVFIRALDAQKESGYAIFGGGFLLSERAAAERAVAKKWTLSEREKALQKTLGVKKEGSAK